MKNLLLVACLFLFLPFFSQNREETRIDTMENKTNKNHIGISQMLIKYSKPTKQTNLQTSVEYLRRFKNQTLVSRLNSIQFFNEKDYSFETEFYQKTGQHSYLFLNASFGIEKKIFPNYNVAAEYYSLAFKKLEYSLGYRLLSFESNDVHLVFGSLGFYYSKYHLVYRPTIQLDKNKGYLTNVFFVRRYFDNEKSYVQIDFQHGNLPYILSESLGFGMLKSSRIILQSKLKFWGTWYIKPFYMFEREEYLPDQFRNKNYLQMGLIKQF